MRSRGSRLAKGECRAIAAALFSVLLASCTSATDPTLSVGMPGYNATSSDIAAASSAQTANAADSASAAPAEPQTLMTAEGDTALPEKIAYLPIAKPGVEFPIAAPAGAQTVAGNTPQALEPGTQPAVAEPTQTAQAAATPAAAVPAVPQAKPQDAKQASATPVMDNPVYVTAGEMPAQPIAPKKKSFLASLFGATPASAAPAESGTPAPQPKAEQQPAKPIITLASAEGDAKPVVALLGADHAFSGDDLPGVRKTALFEITRKSGIDDESDVDLNEDGGPDSYQVASAAGMARLAPNGLLKQTESVDVACLKPSLVRVLKTIEGHYGKKMIVTSGYRDPARNRQARGAKRSLHMYCAAADIQLPGVSKWELASYIRSMPGRGGVGTYCHTESVHVDVGPERDWNWRCRRRN